MKDSVRYTYVLMLNYPAVGNFQCVDCNRSNNFPTKSDLAQHWIDLNHSHSKNWWK